MGQPIGTALAGLLLLLGGLAVWRSESLAVETVGEVLTLGGAVIAVVGVIQAVAWFRDSRE